MSEPRTWARHYQDEWLPAGTRRLPYWLRVAALAWVPTRTTGTPVSGGEMAAILGTLDHAPGVPTDRQGAPRDRRRNRAAPRAGVHGAV